MPAHIAHAIALHSQTLKLQSRHLVAAVFWHCEVFVGALGSCNRNTERMSAVLHPCSGIFPLLLCP